MMMRRRIYKTFLAQVLQSKRGAHLTPRGLQIAALAGSRAL